MQQNVSYIEKEGVSLSEDEGKHFIRESANMSEEELKREQMDRVEENLSTHQFDLTPTSISQRFGF